MRSTSGGDLLSRICIQWWQTFVRRVVQDRPLECIEMYKKSLESSVQLAPQFWTSSGPPWNKVENPRGGFSVQKTLVACVANMGNKISLFVYEWPFIKCKIWRVNGSIFQNFPKIWAIFENSGDCAQNFSKNWANWYMNRSLFLE